MTSVTKKWSCGMAILAIIGLLLAAGGAYGQSAAFATITGRALDPKGASVPNATVTARNTETGLVRTTTTTSDGLYRFDNLAPGIWDVAINVASFNKAEVKNVKLQVGEQRDVNFNLGLAGQTQSVMVTSELPLIETTRTDVSTVIDDKDVANLPTTTSYLAVGGVANDYQGLAASAPGVKFDYSGDSGDIVGPGAVSDRGVMINVDGGNISDQLVSARDALGASVEEVKEFQVLTNNYNAEYGQAGNVILNVITKSGTNSVHGDWHSYFRGRNLGASDFFYNLSGPKDRAPFFKHENGFTVGGPFVKDRIFWFGSWEKVAQGSPATLRPFNTSVTFSQPTNEILGSAKVDAKLTDKHTLTVRYNLQRDLSDNLLVQTGPNTDPSGLVSSVIHDNGLNIGLVSTPTPHTVNEARFYWHRFLSQTPTKSQLPGQRLSNAYVGADFCCPQGALQHRFQYIDNVSYSRGSHTIKAGTSISHYPYDSLFQQYHFGRYESFSLLAGSCKDTPFPLGNGNCPGQFTIGAGPGFVHGTDNIYGAYIQDTWQIRRSITLNYGLRYDFEDGAFKGGSIQNSSVPGGCLQGNGLIPACGSDNNNWQPRVGIAWSPNYDQGILHTVFGGPGKSVVRMSAAEVTQMAYLNVVLDSLNFDGTNLFTQSISFPPFQTDSAGKQTGCFLPTGAPNPTPGNPQACAVLTAFPNSPSAASLAPFTQGVRTKFGRVRPISPTIKNPEIRMASFSIQRQMGPSFVFSVGFQGVYGFGLFGETDENFPTPIADPAHPGFFYVTGRPNPAFTAVRTNFSNRTSGYNSLVVTAQKRLAHHFQFQGSYTWSKTLATGEDFFGLSEPGNPLANLKLDRALAQQDIRHLGNFSFVADTQGLFHQAVVRQVVNNWTFGLVGTLQSGRPYPVSTGDGLFSGSAFPALGNETNQRPNVNPDGTLTTAGIGSVGGSNDNLSEDDVTSCIKAGLPNCSQIQTTWNAPAGASTSGPTDAITGNPVDFRFINGNLARNAGQTLPLYRFDISLTKAFKIPKWESSSLELKLDVFNVFNHTLFILNNGNDALSGVISLPATIGAGFNCTANCINPYTKLYLGANGQPLNVSDFRSGRVDKDFNGTLKFAGLGDPSGTVTPRIMQLAIRFRW